MAGGGATGGHSSRTWVRPDPDPGPGPGTGPLPARRRGAAPRWCAVVVNGRWVMREMVWLYELRWCISEFRSTLRGLCVFLRP